LTFLPPL